MSEKELKTNFNRLIAFSLWLLRKNTLSLSLKFLFCNVLQSFDDLVKNKLYDVVVVVDENVN